VAATLSLVPDPFVIAVVKLPSLHSRRSPDAGQKRQAMTIANHVAKVTLRHLEWEGSGTLLLHVSRS
jgi:hypothetical protein